MSTGVRSTTPPSRVTSKYVSEALPRLRDGRTYITDQMIEENPSLLKFINRTRGAWHRDYKHDMWTTGALDMRIPSTRRQLDDIETTGPVEDQGD